MADRAPPSATCAPADAWLGEMLACSNEYAVVALSLDGAICGWHGAAERLFGYPQRDIVGRPFSRLFTEADIDKRMPQMELELARMTGRSEDDRWHVRSDGSRFWGSGVLTLHLNADRQLVGYIKMLRDRTDVRMRHEALRNRAARLARELRQEREAFATFAHELRNPLAPILNAARIANGDADEGARRRMLDVIVRQTEVIQRLMRDAVERRPVREQRLEMRPLVLQAALKSAVDAVAPEAEAFGLQLLVVMPDTPITLEADPARMQQMVGNLLGNALKYTPRGGHVTVSAGIEGDMAVVRIDDNGEGIAKDNLERVFELFTREESNDIVPGIGVGLAVVKQLAQLHGGFVEARSPGKGLGSQFALQLPLRQAGAA